MGKIEEKKLQKLETLFQSAYELFLNQGFSKTSIHDIVQKAGVAKGTFYLYFRDKEEIRDRLIARKAGELFQASHVELLKQNIDRFEERCVFMVDYILEELRKNKPILRFISKNLSWGICRRAVTQNENDTIFDLKDISRILPMENLSVKLRAPDIMLFLIVELASSASFSTILENDPISFDELKPDLYEGVRAIVRNHII